MTDNNKLFNNFLNYLFVDQKLRKCRHHVGYAKKLLNLLNKRKFTRTNLNNIVGELMNGGYKKGTINKYIAIAKHYDRFIHANCLDGYKYFQQERNFVDPLSTQEIQSLAHMEMNYHKRKEYLNFLYKTLIYFLAVTGCRISEALSLTKKNVMTDSVLFTLTKNGDQRQVPVPEWLIRDMLKIEPDHELVFVSYRNGQLSDSGVGDDLKKRAIACRIKTHVSPHVFRYSFITQMIKEKVPVVYISRIVGHRDLKSTDYYTRLVIQDLKEAQLQHPLLREKLTFKDIVVNIKNAISKSINLSVCRLTFSESENWIAIKIQKV